MTDLCDAAFFRAYVWPDLRKDVENQARDILVSVSSVTMASITDRVLAESERKFMEAHYKLSNLLANTYDSNSVTEEKKRRLAGMQVYTFMYTDVSRLTQRLIDEDPDFVIVKPEE